MRVALIAFSLLLFLGVLADTAFGVAASRQWVDAANANVTSAAARPARADGEIAQAHALGASLLGVAVWVHMLILLAMLGRQWFVVRARRGRAAVVFLLGAAANVLLVADYWVGHVMTARGAPLASLAAQAPGGRLWGLLLAHSFAAAGAAFLFLSCAWLARGLPTAHHRGEPLRKADTWDRW
ncbi:MAG: hypothetical protein HY719_09925 [Planctomycetes bacterium]|nr:hypothetical protein [Planctomycetota bacterium]